MNYRWNKRGSKETSRRVCCSRISKDDPDLARVMAAVMVRRWQMYWCSMSPQITFHCFILTLVWTNILHASLNQDLERGRKNDNNPVTSFCTVEILHTHSIWMYILVYFKGMKMFHKKLHFKKPKPMHWTCCIRKAIFSDFKRKADWCTLGIFNQWLFNKGCIYWCFCFSFTILNLYHLSITIEMAVKVKYKKNRQLHNLAFKWLYVFIFYVGYVTDCDNRIRYNQIAALLI